MALPREKDDDEEGGEDDGDDGRRLSASKRKKKKRKRVLQRKPNRSLQYKEKMDGPKNDTKGDEKNSSSDDQPVRPMSTVKT